MNGRYFVDFGKLATIAMVLGSATLLAITDHLEPAVLTLLFGSAIGYTFGNGIQARKRETPQPMVGHTDAPGEQGPQ